MMAKSNYLGALAAAAGTLAAVGLLVLMLVVVDALPAGAAPPGKKFTKSSTVTQSGLPLAGGNADGARITAAGNPYSFSNTRRIASIKRVTITATILDGETGFGEFDENDLFLELDNINTGIALNGFRDRGTGTEPDTRTNGGIPNHKGALKAALKRDGQLEARIIDADPADQGGNKVGIPENFETTLRITGKLTR
jgi:hypothetical protein